MLCSLLASEPLTGLAFMAMGFVVGTTSGYVVDFIHGPDFLRSKTTNAVVAQPLEHYGAAARSLRPLWLALLVPGLVIGVLLMFQIDPDTLFGPWAELGLATWLGFTGAMLALIMWGSVSSRQFYQSLAGGDTQHQLGETQAQARGERSAFARVVADTNFVTVWVIAAYLIYELGVYYTGADLKTWFAVWAPVVPLVGVLIGMLPGCGPQIVITTLYLNGIIPLSAQLGAAISTDGDALFPAIALAPKTALIATLYGAVPALLVSYTYYWLWE